MITIILPREVKVKKVVIDSSKAERAVEEYNLTVTVYKEGEVTDSTRILSPIEKGQTKEYIMELYEVKFRLLVPSGLYSVAYRRYFSLYLSPNDLSHSSFPFVTIEFAHFLPHVFVVNIIMF